MEQNTLLLYPNDSEAERASNGYLMSLVIVMVGLPIPIVSLIASGIYFLANRKSSSYFVRWHAMQMLLSQWVLIPFNSVAFWWSVRLFFSDNHTITSQYLAYMLCILLLNALELATNVFAAIEVRKKKHVRFWLFSSLTDLWCKA